MSRRPRDYRAEYAQRIARGLAQGLTRSQARGHPRVGETHVSRRAAIPEYHPTLERGLRQLRLGRTLGQAARASHVAPERLRAYLPRTGVVEKQGRRWRVLQDDRLRDVPTYSEGRAITITVRGYEASAHNDRYMAAVGRFKHTLDPAYLAPFEGHGVEDTAGVWHPFETDPNTLLWLTASDPDPFEQVYRIVV
jgi:hypothetical protein